MFDIASWKLLMLAAIVLIVVGPKDLPVMLRTIGKYVGIIRRQAAEFRSQFDEAIRESELHQVKKELETLGQETERTLREAEASVNAEVSGIKSEVEQTYADIAKPLERIEGPAEAPEITAETAVALAETPDVDGAGHVNGSAATLEAPAPAAVPTPDAPVAPPAVAWAPGSPTRAPERVEA